MRVGNNGTYDSGNNYKVGGGTATSEFKLSGFNSNAMAGQINIFDLNEALSTKISTFVMSESNDLTAYNEIGNKGGHTTTSAQNCVQLFLSSGNFTRATFSIYGAL
jgi:general stress protein YciG